MIQCMLKYIRTESRTKFKEDFGYTTALRAADPLTVWNVLLKVHYPGFDVASTLGQSAAANNAYYQLRMGDSSLAEFKRDFFIIRGVRMPSGNGLIKETQAAWDFIWKLDPSRYGNFAAYCNNQIAAGSVADDSFTLEKVFDLLTKYKVEANPVLLKAPQVAFPVSISNNGNNDVAEAIIMTTRALEAVTVAANNNANKGPCQNNGKSSQIEILHAITVAPTLVLTMALLNLRNVMASIISKLKDRISIATVSANTDTIANLPTLL